MWVPGSTTGRSVSMPGLAESRIKKVVVENPSRPFTNFDKHRRMCDKSSIYGTLIKPSMNTVKKAFL